MSIFKASSKKEKYCFFKIVPQKFGFSKVPIHSHSSNNIHIQPGRMDFVGIVRAAKLLAKSNNLDFSTLRFPEVWIEVSSPPRKIQNPAPS